MRDCMDRQVTLPKRVTLLTWGPSPPCKQAISVYLPSQNGYPNYRNFHSYPESNKREKRSNRVSLHLTAMRRDIMGIDKFCGIANRSVTGTCKNCFRLTSPTYSWLDE